MNIFGGAPPLPWFATEVRTRLNASERSDKAVDTTQIRRFILAQAAKFDLSKEALASDFEFMCTPKSISLPIIEEYSQRREELRSDALSKAKVEGSVHSKVLSYELNETASALTLLTTSSSQKLVLSMDEEERTKLANALDEALMALEEYDA